MMHGTSLANQGVVYVARNEGDWVFMRILQAAAISMAVLFAGSTANASPLIAEISGVLDSGTGFDGTGFGTPLDFTLSAPFESTQGSFVGVAYIFATSPTLNITGEGTVTIAPLQALLIFSDPSLPRGIYGEGLAYGCCGTTEDFSTATPAFSAAGPTPTVFSGPSNFESFGADLALTNGHTLTNFFLDSLTSFSIVAAPTPTGTPEPATLSLFGACLAGAAAIRRRKKQSA
jgi:hypothetical protein